MPYVQTLTLAPDPRRQQLARLLMERSLNPQITSGGWGGVLQGVAGLAQAYVGKHLAEKDRAEQEEHRNEMFGRLAEFATESNGGEGTLDPRYIELARAMEGYAPGKGIDFLANQATRDPEKDPLTKVYDPSTGTMRYVRESEAYGRQADAPRVPDAPRTREVRRSNMVVTEEWQPGTGWVEVGSGPAWNPRGDGYGGPTEPQVANNAEIDQARRMLEGITAEDIKRNVPASATGRENPDYNAGLDRLISIATQRKVGVSDPEFENVWSRLYGLTSPGDQSAELASAIDLPPNATEASLRVGQVYRLADGNYRWDGAMFQPVN